MTTNPSSSFQPPQGYRAVPSALEGISVFAPAPQVDATAAPAIYHCPQCGAPTKFDVASGGVACEHCGYTAPVQARQVGRQAAEGEFSLETLDEARHGWGEAPGTKGATRRQLHCEACGAELELA